VTTLNEVFSSLSAQRRYEVWFTRIGLADGSGAWWFRYLLLNPGRKNEECNGQRSPVQVWATWFPAAGAPESFIQGFPLKDLNLSVRGESPFHFHIGQNAIEEKSCRGELRVDGHRISWNIKYDSTFRATVSNKGWIGFSRTSHSDALFSGYISIDGRQHAGAPLGFGVQGHNCGFRHRHFWKWTHAYFPRDDKPASTLEVLMYEMPFGLVFRKAILWHDGQAYVFRHVREINCDREKMEWKIRCRSHSVDLEAAIDGTGPGIHTIPYFKTDCSGTFDVRNNSLASASLLLEKDNGYTETLDSRGGAVLEMVG
jgi:hypothetical protein